jgi:hypothetical protein
MLQKPFSLRVDAYLYTYKLRLSEWKQWYPLAEAVTSNESGTKSYKKLSRLRI